MHKSLIYLTFSILMLFAACSDEKNKDHSGYVIQGNVSGAAAQPIYLEKLAFNQNTVIDTAIIANDGSFEMRGVVDEKGMYMFRINQEASWVVVLDNAELNFTADRNDIFNYSVTGPAENRILLSMVEDIGRAQNLMAAQTQEFQQIQAQGGSVQELQRLQKEYHEQTQYVANYNKTFADTVSSDLLALFAISLMDVNESYQFIVNFVNENQQLASNSLYQQVQQNLQTASPFAVGREAPDFTLSTPRGEKVSLSETRGKIVYLDFWASWCGPCRRENPNLVRLYEEYNDMGFTIFGVSLDNDMSRWVNAIRDDNLKWQWQGSELKGWGCSVARQYQVSAIPATFLLDEDGIIIARNLRGIQLETKLEELFAEKPAS